MQQPLASEDGLAGRLVRRELQRAASSIPGRDIVQVLTELPPGVESGWHTHPGEEVGFIVAGEVEIMVLGRSTVTVRAGEGFLIPPNIRHNARDVGTATGRMLSTYLVAADQPFGDFPMADMLSPALTVIDQDPLTLGTLAAQRILDRLTHPDRRYRRRNVLSVELLERESCSVGDRLNNADRGRDHATERSA